MEPMITITQHDYKKLVEYLKQAKYNPDIPSLCINKLGEEIKRAQKVASTEVEPDIVTINSRIIVEDIDSKRAFEMSIVYPHNADIKEKRISVLAPIGTALIGVQKGQTVEWQMPGAIKKLKVKEIVYQPEANGKLE